MAGKRKIEMKKIENPQARQVIFSKRRKALFKKAAQLSVLCGCRILVIAFSPGGKPYSFGVGDEELVRSFFSGDCVNVAGANVAAISSCGTSEGGDGSSSSVDSWLDQFEPESCNSVDELEIFFARVEEEKSFENRASCSSHVPEVARQALIQADGGFQEMETAATYNPENDDQFCFDRRGLPGSRGEVDSWMLTAGPSASVEWNGLQQSWREPDVLIGDAAVVALPSSDSLQVPQQVATAIDHRNGVSRGFTGMPENRVDALATIQPENSFYLDCMGSPVDMKEIESWLQLDGEGSVPSSAAHQGFPVDDNDWAENTNKGDASVRLSSPIPKQGVILEENGGRARR